MRLIIRVVGFTLVALLIAGIFLDVTVALLAGKPFYGKNYYMLDLGTYSTALTIFIVFGIGVVAAIRWVVRRVFGHRRADTTK